MREAGFGAIEQYIRVSQFPLENISVRDGLLRQVRHGISLGYGSATGSTSLVVARKGRGGQNESDDHDVAKTLMDLSIVHDKFLIDHGK